MLSSGRHSRNVVETNHAGGHQEERFASSILDRAELHWTVHSDLPAARFHHQTNLLVRTEMSRATMPLRSRPRWVVRRSSSFSPLAANGRIPPSFRDGSIQEGNRLHSS